MAGEEAEKLLRRPFCVQRSCIKRDTSFHTAGTAAGTSVLARIGEPGKLLFEDLEQDLDHGEHLLSAVSGDGAAGISP